jgi:hypothetical protein
VRHRRLLRTPERKIGKKEGRKKERKKERNNERKKERKIVILDGQFCRSHISPPVSWLLPRFFVSSALMLLSRHAVAVKVRDKNRASISIGMSTWRCCCLLGTRTSRTAHYTVILITGELRALPPSDVPTLSEYPPLRDGGDTSTAAVASELLEVDA